MKVLITGAGGLVGRNLTEYFSEHGIESIPTDVSGYEVSGNLLDADFVFGNLASLDFDAIVHLAAITDLKKTIENPKLCYEVNCFGTLNMLELATRKNVKRFIFACHDERTRVFTTGGLRRYDELQAGDMVFTINPSTGIIEVQPTERVYVYPFDGKMIHFDGKRIDLLVTPNHKMLVKIPGKLNGRMVWRTVFEEAEHVATRSVCRLVTGQWTGFEKLPIDLIEELSSLEDLFYLTGLFVGDGSLNGKQFQEIKTGLSRSQLVQYHDKPGRFTSPQANPQRKEFYYPRIFFHIPEKDKARQSLEELLRRSSLEWSGYKKSVYFASESLYKLFEQCYAGPPGRHAPQIQRIPRWMLYASPTLLSALLRGLLDSDGSRGSILSTTSPGLVEDTMELCAKLGYFTSCWPRHTISQIDGRRVESWSFQVGISSKAGTPMFGTQFHDVHSEHYKGKVFCIEVKNHNFLVERNGKIAFSGNSSANVFGAPKKNPVTEESPISPRVPYDYSKVIGENMVMSYHKSKGLPVTITRSWLLFGEHDQANRATLRFIKACLSGQPIALHNRGRDTTAPSHVFNFARLLLSILKSGEAIGETFNFGGERVVSVKQLATLIKKLTRSNSKLILAPPRSELEKEPQISYPSTRKIRRVLSYDYELTLAKGLLRTIEWARRGDSS